MKKTSVSILVLLAVVICGCTNTSKKKRNSKEEGVSTTSLNNSSETSLPGQSSVQVISSTPVISSQAPSETPPPPAGTEVTRTIATCLDPFETGTGFAAGRQIDNHDNEQSADKVQNAATLTSYFSSICDVEGMISSLTYTTLNTNLDRNNGNDVYLTIGTTYAGSIVWQSTAQMKKVVLHVNNYHKWYRDYQTETEEQWHTDSAKLIVNEQETPMTVTETNVEPESRVVTYEPANTFTTLTIRNELIGGTNHNRIFLESIEITWVY